MRYHNGERWRFDRLFDGVVNGALRAALRLIIPVVRVECQQRANDTPGWKEVTTSSYRVLGGRCTRTAVVARVAANVRFTSARVETVGLLA